MISKAISFLLLFFASSIHIIGLCQDIRIDHIISVVTDLDSATYEFESLGFTVKSGRLHNNNLFNAHIKFSNRTSLEIMSVAGAPKDKIARDYAELLT